MAGSDRRPASKISAQKLLSWQTPAPARLRLFFWGGGGGAEKTQLQLLIPTKETSPERLKSGENTGSAANSGVPCRESPSKKKTQRKKSPKLHFCCRRPSNGIARRGGNVVCVGGNFLKEPLIPLVPAAAQAATMEVFSKRCHARVSTPRIKSSLLRHGR